MGKRKKTVGGGGSEGGGRVKVYVHPVTNTAADLLNDRLDDKGNKSLLQTVSETSGADVQLDPSPSPVPEMKILVIRGLPKQNEKAVSLIIEKTGSEGTVSDQAEIFWGKWVQEAFPDLLSRAYFVPPVHVNRVPMERQTVADQDVLVLCPPTGQAGQSKESTLSDQDGQFDRLKPRGQTDLNIQPTPLAQSSHDKQPTLPEEPHHENQPTSLLHQSSQSMLPNNSYQSDQSTVSGYSYQSNQCTPLEQVGQCKEPAMICSAVVRPSITPCRDGHVRDNASMGGDLEAGQCNQLILSEQVSHFNVQSPSEQWGGHSQVTLVRPSNQAKSFEHPNQSNKWILPGYCHSSNQSISHEQAGQYVEPPVISSAHAHSILSIPPSNQDIDVSDDSTVQSLHTRHCIQTTLPEHHGQFIQRASSRQSDQYVQLTVPGQTVEIKHLTSPGQCYQSNHMTLFEQANQQTPMAYSYQCNQSMTPGYCLQSNQSLFFGHSYQPNQSILRAHCYQSNQSIPRAHYYQSNQSIPRAHYYQSNQSIPRAHYYQSNQSIPRAHYYQSNQSIPRAHYYQSNQSIPLSHYYQSNQSIPPKQAEVSHPVQTTPHDQSGQYIKQTSCRQSGHYIQETLTQQAAQLNPLTTGAQPCQGNTLTPTQQAGQSSHSTRHIQPCQSNQSMPSKHFGQHKGFEVKDSCPAQMSSSPLPSVQESDVRADKAMQRVLVCLDKMAAEKGEIMFVLSQFTFGQYLGEPCYALAAASMPLAQTLPKASTNDKQGSFDVLVIHRHYGFVVCDVRAIGDNLNMSMSQLDIEIRNKLRNAISKLDKAEAMLSHLVSDIAPGLRITKTIAVPNLTARQVQNSLTGDPQLSQDLCRCLGTTDPADITGLCLCCDQLSDPETPWDVSSHVLRELGHWWQRRVAVAGPDSHMTDVVYTSLVARFCGPATTVTVPCTSSPRLSVNTLGQAVWWTGECYTAVITLFPEQVHLLHTAPPTLFVTGPPGTGKTVVLLLMAIQWLRCGHHVYVVSTCIQSRVACRMLYHLLLQTVKTQQSAGVSPGQPHFLDYDFRFKNKLDKEVQKAVNHLSSVARRGSTYVIADEAGPLYKKHFGTFCEKLLTSVQNLHLWAANCYHGHAPAGWQVEYLRRPLRSPPAVVRVVNRDNIIQRGQSVRRYSDRGVPDHTDGPPVKQIRHEWSHSTRWPADCVTCCREVASFLHSLRVGATENVHTIPTTIASTSNRTTPPCLQWRDVLMLIDRSSTISDDIAIVKELREAGIPVRLMKDDDIDDVAKASSDVVWVAEEKRVRGLERKVVVFVRPFSACTGSYETNCLHSVSRCTSQLVIVSRYSW